MSSSRGCKEGTGMKKTLLCALLCALLLSGCTPLLERSYASVTAHTQFSDEADNEAILRAESYSGLVSALLYLVEQGAENGIVRLYQYTSLTGTASSDVDQACLEVTQQDPLGAYAVDYIKYDVETTASYYQVEVKLAYRVEIEELSSILSVTGSTAVGQELQDLLPEQPEKVLFRIGYFAQSDNEETLAQAVWEAYESLNLPEEALLGVEVQLYPESGQQRLAEIRLLWAGAEGEPLEGEGQEEGTPEAALAEIMGNLVN